MNRAERRKLKNLTDRNNKCEQKRNIENGKKLLYSPATYCNSKPLYIGDVVYLKPASEIPFKYSGKLKMLIDGKHRFVIVSHYGANNGACAVVLLSTSEFLNEQKRRGIRLQGTYNDFKDVYMDLYNVWIIDSTVISHKDYSLNENDKFKIVYSNFDEQLPNKSIKIGTYNSKNVEKEIEFYKSAYLKPPKQDLSNTLNTEEIKYFVDSLSHEEVINLVHKANKEIFIEMGLQLELRIQQEPEKFGNITDEQYDRWLLCLCLRFDNTLKDIYKRGYKYE